MRDIDQLWSRGLTVNAVEALGGFSSDHKPVAANYEAKGTPPMPSKIPALHLSAYQLHRMGFIYG